MSERTVQDIVLFNRLGGNEANKVPYETRESFDDVMKNDLVQRYLDLINEEYEKELLVAKSVDELLDAAGDLIVVTVGLIFAAGYDPLKVMREINRSNLSKFCTTEEDAIESVKRYENDERYFDVKYEKRDDLYVILGRKVGEGNDSAYKILKGIDYSEPDPALFR